MRLDRWLGTSRADDWWGTKGRPASVGAIIGDKPSTITVQRRTGAGTIPGAQVVRIDLYNAPSEGMQDINLVVSGRQRVVVLGYKNHPTVADTDLKMGDEFPYDGDRYRVLMVETALTDRLLAIAEVQDRV